MSSNRITRMTAGRNGRKWLIPFFTAGYPSARQTIELAKVAEDSGSDLVELGMPFSDPLADGPEIQHSSQIALRNGMNLSGVFSIAESIRSKSDLPLILMGYFNPILAYGIDRFARQAGSSGVDGFIIPDLPVTEAGPFLGVAKENGLSVIFLVAPTTTEQRLKAIDSACTDFVYVVTVTGVTGTGRKFGSETDAYLRHLRKSLRKPFVAGFGVSSASTARALAKQADGVVIGSALMRACRESKNFGAARRRIGKLLTEIRHAL